MTTKTVPATLLVLMEGEREVRRLTYPASPFLPNFLVLPDAPLSGRLAQLDFDLPTVTATAAWALDVSRTVEFIPLEEWIAEFDEEPSADAVVTTPSHQRIVVAQPIEYQWIRPS